MSEELRVAARRVQTELERFYALEEGPDVRDFVCPATGSARETLLVRSSNGELELALILPDSAGRSDGRLDDAFLQLIEGVSHFVYVAERARIELPLTALEIELQAEIDKFVIFAFDGSSLSGERARAVHHSLYQTVRFLHPVESEPGTRYRLANALAARLSHRLFREAREGRAHRTLQRFYRLGQEGKIRLASAA